MKVESLLNNDFAVMEFEKGAMKNAPELWKSYKKSQIILVDECDEYLIA
jgi:hypothetical protein